MLDPIYRAMANSYRGDERGDPFHLLLSITCPVMISSSACSPAIYHKMCNIGVRIIPRARLFRFDRSGHYIPQANPEELLDVLEEFAHDT
jgi:pimeloyl-ACP methyl ester carboxylesterase